ncbi:hypothetical protein OKW39_006840 [Paraburkholderia sp. MM6662-R1]
MILNSGSASKSLFDAQVLRQAGVPFTSSIFSRRKSHVGSGAQDEQAPDIFVATSADPEKIGLAARAVLPGNEPNRCRKIATASVLLCVAHFCGQGACGDWADSRDAHQALSNFVLSELTCELLVNLTDLFL